jgi:hypothetical protein
MGGPLFPSTVIVSVWDTSAIIDIRQRIERPRRASVLKALRNLALKGELRFPAEVLAELERYVSPEAGVPDELVHWAHQCRENAVTHATDFDLVRFVHSRAALLTDADSEHEAADPYVLAMGLKLMDEGCRVLVVTEDRRDKPGKMSLATACGLFHVPTLPLRPFLIDLGILAAGSRLA